MEPFSGNKERHTGNVLWDLAFLRIGPGDVDTLKKKSRS
jgi:hypothetical protein